MLLPINRDGPRKRPQEHIRIIHSPMPSTNKEIILASQSEVRKRLLDAAGVRAICVAARVDERSITQALIAEEAKPRDIADTLAELKARKISDRYPQALVIGCDQTLDFQGEVWGKPEDPDVARDQLVRLRGQTHRLHSAVVLYDAGEPIWRHVATVRLKMRDFSDTFLDDYLARNWETARHSVGCYMLEAEGIRLFETVEGDYFSVLGLPLMPLLGYLGMRGFIPA